jgi:amino acid adenylation domain-containing protein
MQANNNIRDIYTLSPLQEGLFYHSLTDKSGAYLVQTSYQLQGDIDIEKIQQTISLLFDRYDILRTAFVYKGLKKMVQVVLNERKPDIFFADISGETDRQAAIDAFLEKDRLQLFDLSKDVLMRFALLKLEDGMYEFIWTYHHILMDGWCTSILISDFSEIYTSLVNGKKPELGPVTQFKEFIVWLESRDKETSLQFWKDYLHGYEEPAHIPGGTPFSGKKYDHREVVEFCPASLLENLEKLAVKQKVTLSTVLNTAWGLLLAFYNDKNDVVYGTVTTIRPPAVKGIDAMVGLFINTIPIRMTHNSTDSFADLLHAQQQAALQTREFDYCSLADIQALSYLRNRLFDHVFVISNASAANSGTTLQTDEQTAGAKRIRVADTKSREQVNYDFSVNVSIAGEMILRFTYNSAVYNESFIRRMATHYLKILSLACQMPGSSLSAWQLIDNSEKLQQLQLGTGPVRQYPGIIDELFNKSVQLRPDKPALIDTGKVLTYQQLSDKSMVLAIELCGNGLKPGDNVCVLCKRSADWIIALLAVWKAGAVYIPLDPAHPDTRLHHIIEDTGAQFLLTDEENFQRLPGTTVTRFNFNKSGGKIYPFGTTCTGASKNSTAYIIYTSGTTGKPKGVPVKQESITDRICWHNEYLEVDENETVLQFASIGFDASLVEILMAFATAGTLVLAPDEIKNNSALCTDYIASKKITLAIFPASYMKLLNSSGMPDLKKIISTGEAALLEEMIGYAAGRSVYNGYGPTETCVGATFHKLKENLFDSYRLSGGIPIGRPFSNTIVLILNAEKKLMPAGAEGEVYIGGIGLTNGYIGQPALNEEKFITNPYSLVAGERLYRSGDKARWNEEGELEYRGRIDSQVQIHGIRVETTEIEKTIKLFPGVSDAFVMLWKDDAGVQLAAYIQESYPVDMDELKSSLQSSLPYYMVPSWLQIIDIFPVTSSGKIDKQAFTKPVFNSNQQEFALPVTATQKKLCQVWEDILETGPVGIHDNFFTSGGHSIRGIKMITLIEKELQVVLTLEKLFRYPTVEALARLIDATRWVNTPVSEPENANEIESMII